MTAQEQNIAFIEKLTAMCRDRGYQAALRRWWSPATRSHAFPALGRLHALDDSRRSLVAALYALHNRDGTPAHRANGPDLGTAALKLGGGGTGSDGFKALEPHFRRLLAANDLEALTPLLGHFIRRFQQAGIALDYTRLLADLRQFSGDPEKVRTRWALRFWQAPDGKEVEP